MDLSVSSLVAQPSLSPRERYSSVKTSMKKRISTRSEERKGFSLRSSLILFYHTTSPWTKTEHWSRGQSCCATSHQQLTLIHPPSSLPPLGLLPQLAMHTAPVYKAAGTNSKDRAQFLVFVLGATGETFPSYSLVRLTIRKSKKENQNELALAG